MKTKQILSILNVLAWIAFIGLCIQTGTFLIAGIIGLMFEGTSQSKIAVIGYDFSDLHFQTKTNFIYLISILIFFSASKAYLFYLTIEILKKINLENPFNKIISDLILKISYVSFEIWIVWVVIDQYIEGLVKSGYDVSTIKNHLDSAGSFIFLAGIIYVIAQIFKRGIELQNENDLTI